MSQDLARIQERLALSRAKFKSLTLALSHALGEAIALFGLDGKVVPVRTQTWLVRDDDGRPQYLLGIFRDISHEAG